MSETDYSVNFPVLNVQKVQIFKDNVEFRCYLRPECLPSRDLTEEARCIVQEGNFSHIVIDRGCKLLLRGCSQ